MLRGDDVGELQRDLSRLGFDAGRVDAIFGPDTHTPLCDFQRNAGFTPTASAESRPSACSCGCAVRAATAPAVATVREAESAPRRAHTWPTVACSSASSAGSAASAGSSSGACARAAPTSCTRRPRRRSPAAAANRFEADVYLGLEAVERSPPSRSPTTRPTASSRAAASELARDCSASRFRAARDRTWARATGMRVADPAATRMPAVLVHARADRAPSSTMRRTWPGRRSAPSQRWVRRPPSTLTRREGADIHAATPSRTGLVTTWGRILWTNHQRVRVATVRSHGTRLGHPPVDPLEILEVGELDDDLAPLRPIVTLTRVSRCVEKSSSSSSRPGGAQLRAARRGGGLASGRPRPVHRRRAVALAHRLLDRRGRDQPSATTRRGQLLLERAVGRAQQRPGVAGGESSVGDASSGCVGGSWNRRSVLLTALGSCRPAWRPARGSARSPRSAAGRPRLPRAG